MHRSSHTLCILKEKNDILLQVVFSKKKKNREKIMRNWHVHVSAMWFFFMKMTYVGFFLLIFRWYLKYPSQVIYSNYKWVHVIYISKCRISVHVQCIGTILMYIHVHFSLPNSILEIILAWHFEREQRWWTLYEVCINL